jgi:hypothetical protein
VNDPIGWLGKAFQLWPRLGHEQQAAYEKAHAALALLDRRERIENRRDAWLYANMSGPNRAVQHMRAADRDHGVSLQVAGKDIAWAWASDYWSALEKALNGAKAP